MAIREHYRRQPGVNVTFVLAVLMCLGEAWSIWQFLFPGPFCIITFAMKTRSDLQTIGGALGRFAVDCGRPPTQKEGLDALYHQPNGLNGWHGPYLQQAGVHDCWGHDYLYQTRGINGRIGYMVLSYGADGHAGGIGNDADVWIDSDEEHN